MDHFRGVIQALELIKDELLPKMRSSPRILIKPNFVSCYSALCATHPQATRGLLEFLSSNYSGKILLAEGPAIGNLEDALRNYGYLELIREYDLDFLDLNEDESEVIYIYDSKLNPIQIRISKTLMNSKFSISICPPKTHDFCILTLSLKNLAVGGIIDGDKSKIHQGYGMINLNLARLIKVLYPQLSIIDGVEGMQGSGPVHGDPMRLGLVGASLDGISLDKLFCVLMGFDPSQIGYLYLSCLDRRRSLDLSDLDLVGETQIQSLITKFKPHPNYSLQLSWRDQLAGLDPLKLMHQNLHSIDPSQR